MDPDIKFTCVNCGKRQTQAAEMAGETVDCTWCGKQTVVPLPVSANGKTDQTTAPTNKACPFCGEQILFIATKCKHCGEFFKEKKRRKFPIISILVGFGILLFLLFMFFVVPVLLKKVLDPLFPPPVPMLNEIDEMYRRRHEKEIDSELKSKEALLGHLERLRESTGDDPPDAMERATEREVEALRDVNRLQKHK